MPVEHGTHAGRVLALGLSQTSPKARQLIHSEGFPLTHSSVSGSGMLTDLMEELAGDDGRAGGAQLRQLPLPEGMAGKTYGELFASMTLTRKLLPLGLYRRKSENPAWRLFYVRSFFLPSWTLEDACAGSPPAESWQSQ